jgi:hypothetical protein
MIRKNGHRFSKKIMLKQEDRAKIRAPADWNKMRLRDLFSVDAMIDPQAGAIEVSGLSSDSRSAKPGDLFFALAGSKTDGARFIDAAIASGAVAVAGEHATHSYGVPFIIAANPRRALALSASKFFPRQPATIAAVTGTSGKTSVAAFTRQIWQRLGHVSARIRSRCIASSMKLRPMASPIWRLRRPRTGSINIGWTVCGFQRAVSPICRATIWITILTWRIIWPRSCGCSAIWSQSKARP